MIAVGINKPGGGISNYLSVDASAFTAWDTNGATYKVDSFAATDGTEIGFSVFAFDQTTEQGIQLMIKNTNSYFKTANMKARLKLRRESAADANDRAHFGVMGRFVTIDPDVSAPTVIPAVNTTLDTDDELVDSDWLDVPIEGTLTDTCILVIDVLRIAANALDSLDGVVQVVNVEFQFNQ